MSFVPYELCKAAKYLLLYIILYQCMYGWRENIERRNESYNHTSAAIFHEKNEHVSDIEQRSDLLKCDLNLLSQMTIYSTIHVILMFK